MTSDYPLISVIIPVHNREKYITQALSSVLDEDYPNLEIVVLNDGSTDSTDNVIKGWIDAHSNIIHIIYKSRENKGVVKTLNELVELSNGEYIVFFGSDDYLKNNGITKRYEYLKNHPNKLMVIADCNLIDRNDALLYESTLLSLGKVDKKYLFSDEGMKKFMILNGFTPGATLMADKRIYQVLGKYDENLHAEDWVYYIRAVSQNLLGYLDEIVSAYRVHGKNMSFSERLILVTKEHFQVTLRMFSEFKSIEHRYYLALKLLYLSAFIPYLIIKLHLLKSNEKYKNNKIGGFIFRSILAMFTLFKSIFNFLTDKIYDKKG